MMSQHNSVAVRVEKVEKWFGRTLALRSVTLSVQSGDFMVLLGRNGAGKSTLLRVMAKLVKPNSGKVEIYGIDIRKDPEQVRLQLGFVAHSSYLYRHLTARENLRFFARLYNLGDTAQRIEEALHWVGLQHSADRQVLGFSRGMQQRLAIARATLHHPELLLLDEPFTGLDLEASELLAEWMRCFVTAGKTIVMATHDLEQGLDGVNRWALLDRGEIVEEWSGQFTVVRDKYKQFLKERKRELS